MKRLSDYKDEAALDLLAELLEPVAVILADDKVKDIYKSKPKLFVAQYVLKEHKKEVIEIFKAIDSDAELTPVSVIKGIIDLLTDIEKDPNIKGFFNFAEQENEVNDVSGSATENIGDGVN